MAEPTLIKISLPTPLAGELEILRASEQRYKERFATKPFKAETPYQKEYLKRVEVPLTVKWPFEYEDYRRVVAQVMKHVGYEVSPATKETIRDLAIYFSGNEGRLDLRKGIYLYGGVGTGKTTLMRIFQRARLHMGKSLAINHVPTISADLLADASADLRDYLKLERCFDDAGAGQAMIRHYGNDVHIFPQLVLLRYETYQREGLMTHVTTNLTPSEMVKQTGVDDRVRSRMNEMFTPVLLDGPDKRMS